MSRNLADGVYCAVCHKRRPAAHFTQRPDHRAGPKASMPSAQDSAIHNGHANGHASASGATWDDLDALDAEEWAALTAEWDRGGLDAADGLGEIGEAVEDGGELGELDADPPVAAELHTEADAQAPAPSWTATLAAAGVGVGILAAVIGIPAAVGTWAARRAALDTGAAGAGQVGPR